MPEYKLSICIATFNRGKFIGQTLDSVLCQIQEGVEVVVVDGDSPDNTSEVMADYLSRHPEISYHRELENSGIDKDYDKAVGYARGEYCWLMTDDDLMKPNAINHVLSKLDGANDLVVVNAEVANVDFSKILDKKLIKIDTDKTYDIDSKDTFMSDTGHGLSFIGCVVIRRETWLVRNRAPYYGSLFIHVGVIFQNPFLEKVELISDPLITIRYGNAMWTPRGLEIWLVKWPNLVWSFLEYSVKSKSAVCPISEYKKLKRLAFYRATGAYGVNEFKQFLLPQCSWFASIIFFLVALFPAKLMNVLASLYCIALDRSARMVVYSLDCSKNKNIVSNWASRVVGV
jgi:glycosyltransferase involved in cell wall biosynthesis